MNERIRELEAQCWETRQLTENANSWHTSFNSQKFARLIAGECADLCDRFQSRDVGMQPAECAGAIRKMFGVE